MLSRFPFQSRRGFDPDAEVGGSSGDACHIHRKVNADEADHTTVYDSPARGGIPTSPDSGNQANVQDVERPVRIRVAGRPLLPQTRPGVARRAATASRTRSHQRERVPEAPRNVARSAERSNKAQPRWRRWGTWLGSWKPACCAPALRLPAPWPGIRIRGHRSPTTTLGIERLTWTAARRPRCRRRRRSERSTRRVVTQWTSLCRALAPTWRRTRRRSPRPPNIPEEPIDYE